MMRPSWLRPVRSKKSLIISAIVLFVVLVGGYIVWSERAWAQVTPGYTQWHQDIKDTVRRAAALPTATTNEKGVALAAIKGISDKIVADHAAICSVSPLILWQQAIVLAYKDTYTTCQRKLSAMDTFQHQLMTVISYSENDQTLAAIIAAAAPSGDELTEADWAQQATAWVEAISATKKMSSTDTFKPIQQSAQVRMAAINTAWQELIASNGAKDKQKYLAAQAALATAIDGLDEVSATSQAAVTKLMGELELVSQKALAE